MKIQLVFLTCLIMSVASAQQYDTIPFIPEYNHERVELFRSEPIEKGHIIFLGNSITQGGNWRKLLKDSTVINRGIAGDITFGILHRLDDVISRQPSKVFLKIGINDISKNIPDDIIVTNILKIVGRLKRGSPSTQIFVHSILPTNDAARQEYPEAHGKNSHVVYINGKLSRTAAKNGFRFIDIASRLQDKNGDLDARYASDGLHLNDLGYQRWVEILKKEKCVE